MGLLLDVPEAGPRSEVSGPSTLNGRTNTLTPLARWAGAAALSLSHCDDSASGCFDFGAMNMSYSYFVQIRYIIFRTPGELLSKTPEEGLGFWQPASWACAGKLLL